MLKCPRLYLSWADLTGIRNGEKKLKRSQQSNRYVLFNLMGEKKMGKEKASLWLRQKQVKIMDINLFSNLK